MASTRLSNEARSKIQFTMLGALIGLLAVLVLPITVANVLTITGALALASIVLAAPKMLEQLRSPPAPMSRRQFLKANDDAAMAPGAIISVFILAIIGFFVVAALTTPFFSSSATVREAGSDTSLVNAALGADGGALFSGLMNVWGLLAGLFILTVIFGLVGWKLYSSKKGL